MRRAALFRMLLRFLSIFVVIFSLASSASLALISILFLDRPDKPGDDRLFLELSFFALFVCFVVPHSFQQFCLLFKTDVPPAYCIS